MTDFHNKNETPNYEPLTDTNSCQQNELTPEEPPIQISEPINIYGRNVTYRTPCQCSCKVCALLYGVFLSCVAMSAFIISIGIYQNQIKLIFIGLFPLICLLFCHLCHPLLLCTSACLFRFESRPLCLIGFILALCITEYKLKEQLL